jgi:type IV pilus assembly protein PilC
LRTGTPETMLMDVALRCRRDAESRRQRLLAIIEPALVALLCVLVGLVILSVMLPLAGILSGM